jgi:hypothetical protein
VKDERTVLRCQQAFGGLSGAAGRYQRYRIGAAMAFAYQGEPSRTWQAGGLLPVQVYHQPAG